MIPLFKVAMDPDVYADVKETLASGYIGEGPRVKEFERILGDYLGGKILAVNSCTSALDMAYHLIGLGQGDVVISTPMTCLATNMPLALRGCDILWADVDPITGNIDPKSVGYLVESRSIIKAIVCTNWAGRTCDYDAIRRVARGIPIVEDAAHSFGAGYYDISSMHGGDYRAWSFQAIKHLTTGDGGALLVPPDQYERAKRLRWYGLDREDSASMRCLQQASEPGFKYQMNDIAASIGLANFTLAIRNVGRARDNARYYDQNLVDQTKAPFDPNCSYWLYTILVDDPAEFEEYMLGVGIQVSQVHTRNDAQECMPNLYGSLDGLDVFQSHMVSIPVGWWLTEANLEKITEAVNFYVEVPVHAV